MVKDSELRERNPWWKTKGRINQDRKIREWEKSTIKYDPGLRHKIDFDNETNIVYTLRGPRQVGKTTLIKLQIKDFLERLGISPWNILYYPFDLAITPKELVEVVERYKKLTKGRTGEKRRYIFLDEVSSIANWQKGIKILYDDGKLENCTVLVTGSQSLNLEKAGERLPGRRGFTTEAYDKILLPMKFSEFVRALNPEIRELMSNVGLIHQKDRESIFNQFRNLEIPKSIERLNDYQNELDEHLDHYLISGGTPLIVNQMALNGTINEAYYTNYLKGILGDWSLEKKNETLLRQLMPAIITGVGSLSTWYSLNKEADMKGEHTVIEYVDTLKRLFLVTLFFRFGEKKKVPMLRDPKKIHFQDPFYLHLFNGWLSTEIPFSLSEDYLDDEIKKSTLVEGIIGSHLVRWAFILSQKKQTFEPTNHVFYWKDDKNKEVDYIFYLGKNMEVPIEVKFRNTPKSLGGFYSFLDKTSTKSGIVISKDDLDIKDNYVSIPASVFLMMI